MQKGDDPNLADKKGHTPLLAAVKEWRLEIVKILLEKGANPILGDDRGYQPFLLAVLSNQEKEGIVTDTKTGLEWFVCQDSKITWNQAQARVQGLKVEDGVGIGKHVFRPDGGFQITPALWRKSQDTIFMRGKRLFFGRSAPSE